MKDETKPKNPNAVALGTLGGKAGKGAIKLRGTKEYYARLSKLRWQKTPTKFKKKTNVAS